MGSRGYYHDEEPPHLVRITRDFYLGTYPVTQTQFAAWRPDHENGFPNQPNHPAERIDWREAREYCRWLAESCAASILAGFIAALPSEAQWEYACRAGTETEYYTGDGEAALAEAGWYDGNSESSTQPVGWLAPNDFGLHDMHGNVWEWCRDAWDAHAYKRRVDGVCDPKTRGDENADRVIRRGSWFASPRFCRAACRGWRWPSDRNWLRGFRVCLFSGPCPDSREAEPASGGVARRDDAAKP